MSAELRKRIRGVAEKCFNAGGVRMAPTAVRAERERWQDWAEALLARAIEEEVNRQVTAERAGAGA